MNEEREVERKRWWRCVGRKWAEREEMEEE